MQASWNLDDATLVVAKMVSPGTWTVHVNGVEVPTSTKRLSLFGSQTDFSLAPGRPASVSVRPSTYGEPEIDLNIDGNALLYPGKRALQCPSCKSATLPRHVVCTRCGSSQPNREQRIQDRRRRALARLILSPAIAFCAVRVPVTLRRLYFSSAPPSASAAEGYVDQLIDCAILAAVVIGLALLSKKAPVTAAIISASIWSLGLIWLVSTPARSLPLAWLIQAWFAYLCYRAIKVAFEIRRHDLALSQSPQAQRGVSEDPGTA